LKDEQKRGELGGVVNHGNVSRETFLEAAAICADLRPIQFEFGLQLCLHRLKCFHLCG